MTASRDPDRLIHAFLHEGLDELPDPVYDAVRDRIEQTRQRAVIGPWRTSHVNRYLQIGLAAAAVLVIAVVAFNLLPGSPTPPGGEPSATTAPSATPANFGDYPDLTALTPGSYVFTHVEPLRVSFTVPSGWEKGDANDWVVWSSEDEKATLAVASVDNLYVDPCRQDSGLRDPVVGPTVDDLATALGSVQGVTFSPAADVTLAGFAGKYLEYIPPDTFGDCAADIFLWSVNGGTDDQVAPAGDRAFRLWILDVDGTRLIITASAPAGLPAFRLAELQAIIDSIQIE